VFDSDEYENQVNPNVHGSGSGIVRRVRRGTVCQSQRP
jgi:hypothetical protein